MSTFGADADADADADDTGTLPPVLPTYNFSMSSSGPLELGDSGWSSVVLATGNQENFVFAHSNVVKSYSPDGTLTTVSEPSGVVSALHTGTDGGIMSCRIEGGHSLFVGDEPATDPPTLIGEITNRCDEIEDDMDCWSGVNKCLFQLQDDGSILAAALHGHGIDDSPHETLYFTGSDGMLTAHLAADAYPIGLSWGGGHNVVYTDYLDGHYAIRLLNLPDMTTQVLLEHVYPIGTATSAARSALTADDGTNVYVYDDSSGPPLTDPMLTLEAMTYPQVTLLNGAVVVVAQDQSAGTFHLNGGAETLVYTYDSAREGVTLTGVATANDRIHVVYRYWNAAEGSQQSTVLIFDAVVAP